MTDTNCFTNNTTTTTATVDMEEKSLHIRLGQDQHRTIKVIAAQTGITIQQLVGTLLTALTIDPKLLFNTAQKINTAQEAN